jgi:acetyltransferase
MERTKIYNALKGVRGWKPVDLEELEQILVRFSQLVSEQRWIKELDINPLLASPDQLLALDARVVIYGDDMKEADLPKLAIRPYPTRYVYKWTAENGELFTIRPIRPEDENMLVAFHETLSDESVYLRYLHPMKLIDRVRHERLGRICHCDYDRQMILVAERIDPDTNQPQILGASRMTKMHGTNDARISVLVSDFYHGKGLGLELLRRLVDVAKREKLERLEAYITVDNVAMRNIVGKLSFTISPSDDPEIVVAALNLKP